MRRIESYAWDGWSIALTVLGLVALVAGALTVVMALRARDWASLAFWIVVCVAGVAVLGANAPAARAHVVADSAGITGVRPGAALRWQQVRSAEVRGNYLIVRADGGSSPLQWLNVRPGLPNDAWVRAIDPERADDLREVVRTRGE